MVREKNLLAQELLIHFDVTRTGVFSLQGIDMRVGTVRFQPYDLFRGKNAMPSRIGIASFQDTGLPQTLQQVLVLRCTGLRTLFHGLTHRLDQVVECRPASTSNRSPKTDRLDRIMRMRGNEDDPEIPLPGSSQKIKTGATRHLHIQKTSSGSRRSNASGPLHRVRLADYLYVRTIKLQQLPQRIAVLLFRRQPAVPKECPCTSKVRIGARKHAR